MPGSRGGEVARLGELFLDAAIRLRALRPGVRFLLPCATPERREQLEQMLAGRDLPLTLLNGLANFDVIVNMYFAAIATRFILAGIDKAQDRKRNQVWRKPGGTSIEA